MHETKHTHVKQAAVATGAQHLATAVGANVSNTIGPSVQADAARGAKAVVKLLTKLFRARGWISDTASSPSP